MSVQAGREPTCTICVYKQVYQMSLVMRKPAFRICENKDADQLRDNREADQHLYFRNTDSAIPLLPKFQAYSHLQWLHSPVFVRPGRKPRRSVFSQRGSNTSMFLLEVKYYLQKTSHHANCRPLTSHFHILNFEVEINKISRDHLICIHAQYLMICCFSSIIFWWG